MQTRNRSMLCGGLISCLVLLGANQACYGQTRARQETQTATSTEVRRVSTMLGFFAQLQSGKKIGTVKDLVISKQSVVEFVVVAFEENFVLVPFDVVRVDIERRVVIIDVERERLLRFRRVARLTDFLTLSTLLRTSILLRGGGEFGLVEDLVISSRGSIDFIVVGFEEKLFAVPFSLARVDFTQKGGFHRRDPGALAASTQFHPRSVPEPCREVGVFATSEHVFPGPKRARRTIG